jgi:hypothetical protein
MEAGSEWDKISEVCSQPIGHSADGQTRRRDFRAWNCPEQMALQPTGERLADYREPFGSFSVDAELERQTARDNYRRG